MAWPYPNLIYGVTNEIIPSGVNAGDLLLYFTGNETVAFGNIVSINDSVSAWTAIEQNIILHDFRERHEVWGKVALGGESGSGLTIVGGAQQNSATVVVKALPTLSFFSGYLDQDVAIFSNPTEWTDPLPTSVVPLNGLATVELVYLITLNFDGGGTTSDYDGPQGIIVFNEGDTLDNGTVIYAQRIAPGSDGTGSSYDVNVSNRFFEGAVILYVHIPFSGPRWNSF